MLENECIRSSRRYQRSELERKSEWIPDQESESEDEVSLSE